MSGAAPEGVHAGVHAAAADPDRSREEAIAAAGAILRPVLGPRLEPGRVLAPLTSFRIGGPAALFAEPQGDDDLAAIARAIGATGVRWTVLGKGSNVLVSDAGVAGLVIRLGRAYRWMEPDGTRMRAGAAMPLPRVSGGAAAAGLTGLEFGVAIPGSLGGAVRMNAGAHARSMSDVVESVRTFSIPDGTTRVVPAEEAGFAYRTSAFGRGTLVLEATMALREADPRTIRELMDEARAWRRDTQPLAEPSCGSVFKNPPGDHAARLVDAAGCKGLAHGGAQVSTKHANFIVTRPGATAADVFAVIRDVRARVRDRFGVELETEVEFVGDPDAHRA
jgi:UDP-N-acetylmuramate dehydrogenase